MPTKRKNAARKRRVNPTPTPTDVSSLPRFESDLLTRGEAAEPGKDGKLPRKATHAVVKKKDGTLEFKRDKFKMF
jgi:hypothetical protein